MLSELIFSIILLSWLPAYASVLIITHAYNRPDFIELQCKTFGKLLKDDYEFVVFNDAVDPVLHEDINAMCHKWDIKCIPVPQEIHSRPYLPREPGDPLNRPNIRHVNCIQYSLDTLGFHHDGIVAIVDSDIFLIRPLSIESHMQDCEILAVIRGADNHVYYLWPGLTFLDMRRLPNKETMNFNCGVVNETIVDSGGHTYTYLINNPSVKFKSAGEIFSYQLFCPDRFAPEHLIDVSTPKNEQLNKLTQLGFDDTEIKFLQQKPDSFNFAFDHQFLHYRAGTNYDNQSDEQQATKYRLILEFIDEILADH